MVIAKPPFPLLIVHSIDEKPFQYPSLNSISGSEGRSSLTLGAWFMLQLRMRRPSKPSASLSCQTKWHSSTRGLQMLETSAKPHQRQRFLGNNGSFLDQSLRSRLTKLYADKAAYSIKNRFHRTSTPRPANFKIPQHNAPPLQLPHSLSVHDTMTITLPHKPIPTTATATTADFPQNKRHHRPQQHAH